VHLVSLSEAEPEEVVDLFIIVYDKQRFPFRALSRGHGIRR
jgi:hypothetical protein